jgi:hypothetical protein
LLLAINCKIIREQMRAKTLWASVLIVTLIIAGYTIYSTTNIQYFECRAGEFGFETYEEDGVKDSLHLSVPKSIKVKKYLLGYYYTIDNYKKEECNLYEDSLMCSRDESYVDLNLATGKVDIEEKYEFEKKKIRANKYNWECSGVERVVK